MTDTDKGFQPDAFYAALVQTVSSRKVTWKQVSIDTKVSPTTLTRMAQGRQPDAASLAALSAWAGINPADYVKSKGKKTAPEPEPMVAISALLRADPKLKPEAAKALESIIQAAYEGLKEGKNKK